MTASTLREFISQLEAAGELARIPVEVDPDQDITIIQHKMLAQQGPALLQGLTLPAHIKPLRNAETG